MGIVHTGRHMGGLSLEHCGGYGNLDERTARDLTRLRKGRLYNGAMAGRRKPGDLSVVAKQVEDVGSAVSLMGHNTDATGMWPMPHKKMGFVVLLYDQLPAAPFPISGYPVSSPESSPK